MFLVLVLGVPVTERLPRWELQDAVSGAAVSMHWRCLQNGLHLVP